MQMAIFVIGADAVAVSSVLRVCRGGAGGEGVDKKTNYM